MRVLIDLDGTIVDLWGYPDVYGCFADGNADCYRYSRPLVDTAALADVLCRLSNRGWEVYIVSHNCKGADRAYRRAVADAKAEWLERYGIPYDRLLVVPYGTPKTRYMGVGHNVLIDDCAPNRDAFRDAGGTAFDEDEVIDSLGTLLCWYE